MARSYVYHHNRPLGHGEIPPVSSPAIPRDAATLILARQRRGGIEVLMGRRSRKAKFVPDVFVFPGGRLDPSDWAAKPSEELQVSLKQLGVRGSARKARALGNAAVRETYEETGLLLTGEGDVGHSEDETWQDLRDQRLAPDLSRLAYLGRAITSPYSPIRFHARFFLADGDHATGKLGGSGELSDLQWTSIKNAINDLPIIDVTEFMLKEVEQVLTDPKALASRPLFSYRRLVPYVRYD
jgi:8-oxo-dGTP pyrophosphatase MutT (NUDIX family)